MRQSVLIDAVARAFHGFKWGPHGCFKLGDELINLTDPETGETHPLVRSLCPLLPRGPRRHMKLCESACGDWFPVGYGAQPRDVDIRARVEASVPRALRRWCKVHGDSAIVKYCTAISKADGGKLIRLTSGDYVSLMWEEDGEPTLEYAKIVTLISVVHENQESLFFLPHWFNRISENGRELIDTVTKCCTLKKDEDFGEDIVAVGLICQAGMKVHACAKVSATDLQDVEDVCKEDHIDTNRWFIYTKDQGFRGVHRWE